MADEQQLSANCELADYIAGCALGMTIHLYYDRKTNKYTFFGSHNPKLCDLYRDQTAFFDKMHPVLGSYRKKAGRQIFSISPFVLETIYRENKCRPGRPFFAQLHHLALEQWIEHDKLKHSAMGGPPSVSVPIQYILIDMSRLRTYGKKFCAEFGRPADSLIYRNAKEHTGFIVERFE